jgi:hypothetical protein
MNFVAIRSENRMSIDNSVIELDLSGRLAPNIELLIWRGAAGVGEIEYNDRPRALQQFGDVMPYIGLVDYFLSAANAQTNAIPATFNLTLETAQRIKSGAVEIIYNSKRRLPIYAWTSSGTYWWSASDDSVISAQSMMIELPGALDLIGQINDRISDINYYIVELASAQRNHINSAFIARLNTEVGPQALAGGAGGRPIGPQGNFAMPGLQGGLAGIPTPFNWISGVSTIDAVLVPLVNEINARINEINVWIVAVLIDQRDFINHHIIGVSSGSLQAAAVFQIGTVANPGFYGPIAAIPHFFNNINWMSAVAGYMDVVNHMNDRIAHINAYIVAPLNAQRDYFNWINTMYWHQLAASGQGARPGLPHHSLPYIPQVFYGVPPIPGGGGSGAQWEATDIMLNIGLSKGDTQRLLQLIAVRTDQLRATKLLKQREIRFLPTIQDVLNYDVAVGWVTY